MAASARNFVVPGINRDDGAGKTTGNEIGEDARANRARLPAGPDNGDRPGIEQSFQAMWTHLASSFPER
jgi:hypothetical protein